MARKMKVVLPGRPLARFFEKHPVALTDDERLAFGDQLAEVQRDLRDHEVKAKAVKDELKSKEGELETRRAYLSSVLLTRAEERDVEVQVEAHPDRRLWVREVRLDTGEVVRERTAREEELQGDLLALLPEASRDAKNS